jgi:hypothetical protein
VIKNGELNSKTQKHDSQINLKQKRKEDALELAQLVYDMYLADQTDYSSNAKMKSEEEHKNA